METEHFKLVKKQKADIVYEVQIKNIDGSAEVFCYIKQNKETKQLSVEFVGTKLQDYITNWSLFIELVQILDLGIIFEL